MTNELLSLIVGYLACGQIAEERYLSYDEVQYCSAIYQEIKIAFVPNVDTRGYFEMSPKDQHAVNKAGFTAFYTWRQDNPETVSFLERVARGEVQLGEAS
ncbi:MAG: hypothetical protein AAF718_11250 [Pseudomonadota bacterium]